MVNLFLTITWTRKESKDWSYGLQCYNQLNNSSAKKRKALGADAANYCDANMVAEWKLDFMAYEIFSMLFAEKKNKAMIEQAIKLVSKCYATKPADHDLKAVNRNIAKLKGKIANLVDMRADGDLSKEEYRRRRLLYDEELNALQKKALKVEESMVSVEEKLNLNAIKASLKSVLNVEGSIIDEQLVRQFVSKVIMISKYEYRWILNLSGKEYDPSIDDDSEIQSTMTLTFAQARAWRLRNGDYIRNRQWQDLTVDIRII